jgi:uncharacterized protein (TIGR03067 family)
MKTRLAMIMMVGVLMAADDPKGDVAKKEQEKLQGIWKVVSGEQGGKPLPDGALSLKFVFAGEKVKTGEESTSYRLDPAATPRRIDLTNDQKETMLGIYQLDGDRLKICYSDPGEKRPTEFATKPGAKMLLFVLDREKP